MSMTRESVAENAKTISATWSNTSAPRDRGQRSLLPHDRFDNAEVFAFVGGGEARLGRALTCSPRGREGAERTKVRRSAVDRIVGTTRPWNGGQPGVHRHCFSQQRDLVGID